MRDGLTLVRMSERPMTLLVCCAMAGALLAQEGSDQLKSNSDQAQQVFDNTIAKPAAQEQVLKEELPVYPGGETALYAFISKETKYPEEAREQGGLLTQEDLAEILQCDVRTIRRDIYTLKQRGFELPTRGQQQDIGPGVSHRSLAVEKWLEGKEPPEIARLIRHSVASVESYLEKFKRVAWLSREKGFDAFEIALTVGMSVVSTRLYLDLCAEHRDTPELARRIEDIKAVGQAFYRAQDEKKRSSCATGSKCIWRRK
mgnify:CR=1 FL=1